MKNVSNYNLRRAQDNYYLIQNPYGHSPKTSEFDFVSLLYHLIDNNEGKRIRIWMESRLPKEHKSLLELVVSEHNRFTRANSSLANLPKQVKKPKTPRTR